MKKKEQNKETSGGRQKDTGNEEIRIDHNVEFEELKKKSKEYLELAQRTMADFDNYKKRTIKEKELLYADAVNSIVSKFLPVLDSLEAALKVLKEGNNNKSIIDGVELVAEQFEKTLKDIGVEEIIATGEKFDPRYHYAVAHIQDAGYSDNEIVEELQRGFIINERVIRHSMVKVAN